MLFKENMRMGISVVSRYDMDHILETPFRHRAVEPNISTLNQSPKAEILQVQPPSVSKILLVRVLLYCLSCLLTLKLLIFRVDKFVLSIFIVSLSEGFTPQAGLYVIHLTCCLSCFLSG